MLNGYLKALASAETTNHRTSEPELIDGDNLEWEIMT